MVHNLTLLIYALALGVSLYLSYLVLLEKKLLIHLVWISDLFLLGLIAFQTTGIVPSIPVFIWGPIATINLIAHGWLIASQILQTADLKVKVLSISLMILLLSAAGLGLLSFVLDQPSKSPETTNETPQAGGSALSSLINPNPTNTNTNSEADSPSKPTSEVSIQTQSTPQTPFPQISLAVDIINQKKAGTTPTWQSIDQAQLNRYISERNELDAVLEVPAEYQNYYSSPASQAHITDLLFEAREEYLAFLKAKGVSSQYLDEINTRILPANPDRLSYNSRTDADAPLSITTEYVDDGIMDFGRRKIGITAVDAYKITRFLQQTDFAKSYDFETLRDMGIRFVLYHEMTHVFQKTYENLHVPVEKRQEFGTATDASQTLIPLSSHLHWKWSEYESENYLKNRTVSNESQADGVGFQALAWKYDLKPDQQQMVWNNLFGRLTQAQNNLNTLKQFYDSTSHSSPLDLTEDCLSAFSSYPNQDKPVLERLCRQLNNLPAYVGYSHPMKPQDSSAFWQATQQ